VIAFALIATFLVRLVVASQRIVPVTGTAGMIGEIGKAITDLAPGRVGRVLTHGEIWQSTSNESIPEGAQVRVTQVDGLTLVVRRD
jgi:membrane-bound ClpP family serine protease